MGLHGFSDKGWKQYKDDRRFLYGGKRQIHLRKNFERRGKGGGGGATAGWGKVVEEITAADLAADPPYMGYGKINPGYFVDPTDDIDDEPAGGIDNLEVAFNEEVEYIIYSTAGEAIPVDTVIQWKTLLHEGKRFVDVVHCESA
jgi:hypothetical protein